MKRLFPAAIILVFVISVCVCAHLYVDRACDETLKDIENYYNKNIAAATLEDIWHQRKENMSLFVNHDFLDKISVYIGQLTLTSAQDNPTFFDTVYKNIESVLQLIKEEQSFGLHSFY